MVAGNLGLDVSSSTDVLYSAYFVTRTFRQPDLNFPSEDTSLPFFTLQRGSIKLLSINPAARLRKLNRRGDLAYLNRLDEEELMPAASWLTSTDDIY